MDSDLAVGYSVMQLSNNWRLGPVSRTAASQSFRARKAIFRSSVSKNREVYTPETYFMKGTSLHL